MSDNNQQPEAVPFIETMEATDKAGAVADGSYAVLLSRVEMVKGTKYQSDEPQDKLRFVFVVQQGPEQSAEIWQLVNLPDAVNGSRKIGKKSKVREFCETLQGRKYADGEAVKPSSFIGKQGWANVVDGKFQAFIPMQQQHVEPADTQEAEVAVADSEQAVETF